MPREGRQIQSGTPGFDVIGDIHGYADALRRLLEAMDYAPRDGVYRHPSRTAVFVGDFVDRGPNQRETLGIARAMIVADSARAVMGNHEFNATADATPDGAGLLAYAQCEEQRAAPRLPRPDR
jgi:hypothetical protein